MPMNKDQYKLNKLRCINNKSMAIHDSKFKMNEARTYYFAPIKGIDANISTQTPTTIMWYQYEWSVWGYYLCGIN